jgi:hypothetical protein
MKPESPPHCLVGEVELPKSWNSKGESLVSPCPQRLCMALGFPRRSILHARFINMGGIRDSPPLIIERGLRPPSRLEERFDDGGQRLASRIPYTEHA